MIYTSNYKNFNLSKFKSISISMDKGKDAGYKGDCILSLAPKYYFFRKYKDNRGIISDEENEMYYIREYYQQVLSCLDPSEIYNMLDGMIMLCYENNTDFCHRHIVAAWLELLLDVNVYEVTQEDNKLVKIDKPKRIKEMLEHVMRENIDMHGFDSLRAAYLYEQYLKIEDKDMKDVLIREASDVDERHKIKVKK